LMSGTVARDGESVALYTDGAARGNPGPAAIGAVAFRGAEELFTISRFIGVATNNVAEYLALIAGLERVAKLAPRQVRVMLDSELVERQLNGGYKVKDPKLKPLHARALEVARSFEKCEFVHVPREENREADRLANAALDRARKKPAGRGGL